MQRGDLERFLKQQKGELLTEDELMLKFVQLCLALHHVHAKVRIAWQGYAAVSVHVHGCDGLISPDSESLTHPLQPQNPKHHKSRV